MTSCMKFFFCTCHSSIVFFLHSSKHFCLFRSKAEKARRDLSEEVESYKLELEETQDKTASHHAMRTKREEEYTQLQVRVGFSITILLMRAQCCVLKKNLHILFCDCAPLCSSRISIEKWNTLLTPIRSSSFDPFMTPPPAPLFIIHCHTLENPL